MSDKVTLEHAAEVVFVGVLAVARAKLAAKNTARVPKGRLKVAQDEILGNRTSYE
jgi:hypothetical protein